VDEDDLTARSRIRAAALDQFGRLGERATTIREIARAAGVSPGLVQHHFGTKQRLRAACDAYVAAFLRAEARQAVGEGAMADPEYLAVAYREAPLVVRYLAQALTDGSPAGAALFDDMVALTEEHLGERPGDVRGQAAVFTAMKLGVVVLHAHLSRALGEDALSPAAMPRVSAAVLEVIDAGFAGQETIDLARAGLAGHRQHPPTAEEP
jgi:AcrR family transcriptional regulator